MTRKYNIAILDGDGVGPEVVGSAREVLGAAAGRHGLNLDFVTLPIGMEAYHKFGRTLPLETIEGMKDSDGWVLGPLQSGSYPRDDKDYPMASGKIRKAFDLYANIRPVKSLLTLDSAISKNNVDLVIVRENTEDFYPDRNLYKGYGEFWPDKDTVISLRVITRGACRRIAETGFGIARARKKAKLVTAVHKSNVLIEGDGLFLGEVRDIKNKFPDVRLEERLVDSTAMQLILSPESFDVILTTNMFGDILSDEAAALVGGLGLAPSLNAGARHAMAQAVHGSAPDIAGKGIVNPVAEILSCSMLLDWMYSAGNGKGDESLFAAARTIEIMIKEQLSSNDSHDRTRDIGGQAGTKEFTERLVRRINDGRPIEK